MRGYWIPAFTALVFPLLGGEAQAQKNCKKGKPCGNSCIAADKVFRLGPPSEAVSSGSGAAKGETAFPSRECRVTRIVDGDTIDCEDSRIRLLLIDTPERSQAPFGRLASEALERMLPIDSKVRLEFDVDRKDRYGRELAYIFTPSGTLINEELARQGFAVTLVYPPNVRYVERIRAAVEAAKASRVGLWAVDAFSCLPTDARAGRCE